MTPTLPVELFERIMVLCPPSSYPSLSRVNRTARLAVCAALHKTVTIHTPTQAGIFTRSMLLPAFSDKSRRASLVLNLWSSGRYNASDPYFLTRFLACNNVSNYAMTGHQHMEVVRSMNTSIDHTPRPTHPIQVTILDPPTGWEGHEHKFPAKNWYDRITHFRFALLRQYDLEYISPIFTCINLTHLAIPYYNKHHEIDWLDEVFIQTIACCRDLEMFVAVLIPKKSTRSKILEARGGLMTRCFNEPRMFMLGSGSYDAELRAEWRAEADGNLPSIWERARAYTNQLRHE